ncbi:MAG TPA: hypothetical protein VIV66_09355 [Pyrinomonadaceae bacterium]
MTTAQNVQTNLKPTNCENHIAVLEAANHDAGKDGLIILIGRLGSGDNKPDLNRHRLHSARAYLTDYLSARSTNTIVIAEGEKVEGYGRIEIYVGGKLYYVFAIKANGDLAVGSCEPADIDDARQRKLRKKLYPWLYPKQQPPARKTATKQDEHGLDYSYDNRVRFSVDRTAELRTSRNYDPAAGW